MPGQTDSVLARPCPAKPSLVPVRSTLKRPKFPDFSGRQSPIPMICAAVSRHRRIRQEYFGNRSARSLDQGADRVGHYGNESEVVRELIRELQIREQETRAEIEAIRAALIEGEKSDFSSSSVDAIWE